MLNLYFALSNIYIFFWGWGEQWPTYQHLTNCRSATLNSSPTILWDTGFRESIKCRHSICLLLHVGTRSLPSDIDERLLQSFHFMFRQVFMQSFDDAYIADDLHAILLHMVPYWPFSSRHQLKLFLSLRKNSDLTLFTMRNCNLTS
jgi:hypothetical protein